MPVPLTSPSHRLPTGSAVGVLRFVMSSHHILTADHPSSQSHTSTVAVAPYFFFFLPAPPKMPRRFGMDRVGLSDASRCRYIRRMHQFAHTRLHVWQLALY